jgi:hypothetical protein
MRKTTKTLLATCVCLPVLWTTPAHADNGYPPAAPPAGFTGGGGSIEVPATGGGVLARTGTDLVTPTALGAGATALGVVLVLAGKRRSRRHA